jgi:hypothetical protein
MDEGSVEGEASVKLLERKLRLPSEKKLNAN